jgi:hypothetical protein
MLQPFPVLVQSLAHINVLHRHCVFFSLFPLGPRGLAHIQNDRPQFTPGFLVSMVLQGSPCSHLGEMGFEKSFPQLCFDDSALASSIVATRLDSPGIIIGSLCSWTPSSKNEAALTPLWPPFLGTAVGVGSGGSSLTVSASLAVVEPLVAGDLAWKNPLRLCCPLVDPFVTAGCDPNLVRFVAGIETSGRCALLELVDRLGLATGKESLGKAPFWLFSTTASAPLLRGGGAMATDVDGLLSSVSSGSAKLLCDDNEGFRENMSLMLRRRSNSGMSLPDIGNRFFVDHSSLRLPSTTIPCRLTISLTYVSLPSRLTFSFRIA